MVRLRRTALGAGGRHNSFDSTLGTGGLLSSVGVSGAWGAGPSVQALPEEYRT